MGMLDRSQAIGRCQGIRQRDSSDGACLPPLWRAGIRGHSGGSSLVRQILWITPPLSPGNATVTVCRPAESRCTL